MTSKPIFQPSFGNRPDQIVGREEIIAQLTSSLESYRGSRERASVLLGQRGMGKTALLLELGDIAEQHGYVAARVTCGPGMLDAIIALLQESGSRHIKNPKRKIRGLSAGAFGFSFGLTFDDETKESAGFRIKLGMICERLAEEGKRVLLLVDEVDPSSEELRQLASTYQELVGDDRDVAIVMAGLPNAVSDLLNVGTLTFLARAQRIMLDLVSVASVELYYASAFTRAKRSVDSSLVHAAAEATQGFPYLLQLIGYFLVAGTSEGQAVDGADVDRAIQLAYAEMDETVVRTVLRQLSDGDLAFLKAMAEDRNTSKISDITKRLGMSQGAVQTYRRRLLDARVIFSPRRGEVAFSIPRMAEHFRQED